MNLRDYLCNPQTRRDLCQALGVSQVQLSQWLCGFRRPSPETCVAIEQATNGNVGADDLRPDLRFERVRDPKWPHKKGRPLLDVRRPTALTARPRPPTNKQ